LDLQRKTEIKTSHQPLPQVEEDEVEDTIFFFDKRTILFKTKLSLATKLGPSFLRVFACICEKKGGLYKKKPYLIARHN
jgi:hypothetical protein